VLLEQIKSVVVIDVMAKRAMHMHDVASVD
jgi:hypothetical protein